VPWTRLRRGVVGSTKAAAAEPGSLRRILFDQAVDLGIAAGSNGVHASAGPLEGMVEMHRFFAMGRLTCFERLLLVEFGLSVTDVARLTENPGLRRGADIVSAFDLTEEHDSVTAARLLVEAMRQA
jgi:hypothetical protein